MKKIIAALLLLTLLPFTALATAESAAGTW